MNPDCQDIQIWSRGGSISQTNHNLHLCSVTCHLCPLLSDYFYLLCNLPYWEAKVHWPGPCQYFFYLLFIFSLGILIWNEWREGTMYIPGVLKYLNWKKLVYYKSISIKNRGNFTPKEKNTRETNLALCFRRRTLLFVTKICLLIQALNTHMWVI